MRKKLPGFIKDIRELKYPYSLFVGQKVVVTLMDGTEYRGVFLKYSRFEIQIATNIGTEDNPKKGVAIIHKTDIISIKENHKGYRKPDYMITRNTKKKPNKQKENDA